jgi:hypothetical protein
LTKKKLVPHIGITNCPQLQPEKDEDLMSLISYQCKQINYSKEQAICGLEENWVIRIEGTYLVAL